MKEKFVAYYRVSTNKQGLDGNGIEAQRQAVGRYLATQEGELIGSFLEVESGKINQRPQLCLALQLARAERATVVIAKLDRLGRNAAFLLQLQDSGTDFVCCDCPNADRFTVGILALVAQRERELISERTRAGLAVAKQRGIVLGGPNAKETIRIAQEAIQKRKKGFLASIINPIKEIQSTGVLSLNRIADCLNKRGEKTPRGGKFTATTVKRILQFQDV